MSRAKARPSSLITVAKLRPTIEALEHSQNQNHQELMEALRENTQAVREISELISKIIMYVVGAFFAVVNIEVTIQAWDWIKVHWPA
jgi:flagellar biosynthesis protein FlhB